MVSISERESVSITKCRTDVIVAAINTAVAIVLPGAQEAPVASNTSSRPPRMSRPRRMLAREEDTIPAAVRINTHPANRVGADCTTSTAETTEALPPERARSSLRKFRSHITRAAITGPSRAELTGTSSQGAPLAQPDRDLAALPPLGYAALPPQGRAHPMVTVRHRATLRHTLCSKTLIISPQSSMGRTLYLGKKHVI
jgi:hypothetical protein